MTIYDINGNIVMSQEEKFEPYGYDIPSMYWQGLNGADAPTSKDAGEIIGKIEYVSETLRFTEYGTIKVQGNTSVNYPKKNFTLKTYSDAECTKKSKHEFLSWGKMSKWVLKAHWAESSHLRNISLGRIWGQIVRSRSDYDSLPVELRESPNQGATDGFHVKMFINGQYWGLYEWIVPKDKLFGQDDENANHSILNSSDRNASTTFRSSTGTNWDEELHDTKSLAIRTSFSNLAQMIINGGFSFVNEKLDTLSAIDWDIFARIFLLSDSMGFNQIFFTYDGVKWYEGAWDLDATIGNNSSGGLTFAYDTEFPGGYNWSRYPTDSPKSVLLYDRVEELFTSQFKERYAELREGVLSENNILSVFEEVVRPILNYDGLYAEDYASTTGGGAFTNMPSVTTNNIQQIREFIHNRIAYMDSVIAEM